jgi:uncharacterized protein YeaO (DUF488 family)
MRITIKRIYEPAVPQDGYRVLVDRLWPRGISKEMARIDLWLREIAPSNELRRWFNHDPKKWKTFSTRYRKELREKPELVMTLKQQAQRKPLTLLYSAHEEKFNQAAALCEILTKSMAKKASRS